MFLKSVFLSTPEPKVPIVYLLTDNDGTDALHHLIGQIAPAFMKVHKFDVHIGAQSVLVKENRSSSVVGQLEPICHNIMVDILNCFLQCDDMPLAGDLLLNSDFSSTSVSWCPSVTAEPESF